MTLFLVPVRHPFLLKSLLENKNIDDGKSQSQFESHIKNSFDPEEERSMQDTRERN